MNSGQQELILFSLSLSFYLQVTLYYCQSSGSVGTNQGLYRFYTSHRKCEEFDFFPKNVRNLTFFPKMWGIWLFSKNVSKSEISWEISENGILNLRWTRVRFPAPNGTWPYASIWRLWMRTDASPTTDDRASARMRRSSISSHGFSILCLRSKFFVYVWLNPSD